MVLNEKKTGLNTEDYFQLINVFTVTLNEHKEVMNSINVFPVPDADTGTNMYISVKGIKDQLQDKDVKLSLSSISKSVANFSLLTAQGNSGLLIAQLFRGFMTSLANSNTLGVVELVKTLKATYEFAQSSVHEPQEGTIITVMRTCAETAKKVSKIKGCTLGSVWKAVSDRAKEAVEETKEQMDLLKQADVIDSGAYGFAIMLEAASNCIEEDLQGNISLKVDGANSFVPEISIHQSIDRTFFNAIPEEEKWGFCTVFAISGNKLKPKNIRLQLSKLGRSVVVSGDENVVKVHLHTEEPDQILVASKKFGDISNEVISNMDEQFKEMREKLSKQYSNEMSLVVIIEGEGIETFVVENTWGVIDILKSSSFKNMTEKEFTEFLGQIPSESKLFMVNSEFNYEKAQSMIKNIHNVRFINTKNEAQIIAAIFCFSPEQEIEENIISMEDAVRENKSFFITLDQSKDFNFVKNKISGLLGTVDLSGSVVTIFHSSNLDKKDVLDFQNSFSQSYEGVSIETIPCSSVEWEYLVSIE